MGVGKDAQQMTEIFITDIDKYISPRRKDTTTATHEPLKKQCKVIAIRLLTYTHLMSTQPKVETRTSH